MAIRHYIPTVDFKDYLVVPPIIGRDVSRNNAVYHEAVLNLDGPVVPDHGILKDFIPFAVDSDENQLTNPGIVVGGIDAESCTAWLIQDFFDNFTSDKMTVGLVGVCVKIGFYHLGTGFGADVLSNLSTEGTKFIFRGFESCLVHGIPVVGLCNVVLITRLMDGRARGYGIRTKT